MGQLEFVYFGALFALLGMLLFKGIACIVCLFQGKVINWYKYNKVMGKLAMVVFFPIVIICGSDSCLFW